MNNKDVAHLLYNIADLLDLKGDLFFKTRAYRLAAATIETLNENIADVVHQHRLQDIPGIGEALAKKITEYVETGKLTYYQRLTTEIPESLLTLLDIPSLGPKKVAALYHTLGITTVDELKAACLAGKLRDLEGFGEITEMNIIRGINLSLKTSGRALLHVAYEDGNRYHTYLTQCPDIQKVAIAGSLRRMKETIGDIDILAVATNPINVMNYFITYPNIQRVLVQGETKTSVLLKDNLQVDLRVVPPESYGAALQYFTGSKNHNVKMRSRAIKHGYKLNEYGLFTKTTNHAVAGATEEDIYTTLGLSYIPPELRENTGEIEAAAKHQLPQLVTPADIKGDLHVHSQWSDGTASIASLVEAAQHLGYSYLGITDHSQSLHVAHGLSEERIDKKIQEIATINKKLETCRILCGTECDILPDGTLDYPDHVLKKLDFAYIGIHMKFKMTKKEMTQRIIKGMENEYANFLAHPTCRMIGRREPVDLDIDAIFDAAQQTNTRLEINSFPDRLDLNDIHAKRAKEHGIQMIIGTDAHFIDHLPFIRYGIATARRGWLEKHDILNTYTLSELTKHLNR
jgi:DNA polymerase (family 10)